MTKESVIPGRDKTESPFQLSSEPLIPNQIADSETTVAVALAEPEPVPTSTFENLGELPSFYQSGQIYLAARDPHWLFCYWDLDLSQKNSRFSPDAPFFLKVYRSSGELVDQIRVNTQAKNWYFPINDAGVCYSVELGFNDPADQWVSLARSNEALAPSDKFQDGPAQFASVPFHLSFERMLQMVREDLADGISLVGALARLQDSPDASIRQLAGVWTQEQKQLLEALLGTDLVSQISLGSVEVDQIFRKRLGEVLSESLSSPSSSELSFLQNLVGLRWNESSLFSGVGASWSSSAGPGESSWSSAIGGESSWTGLAGGESSWTSAMESSWLSGIGSESSWSGALGSSWSAQPFGGAGRDFFMHVNAEVIFYGGTHPDATVWIDGKEIALTADGSFRYHFRLPDGEFEIPIVAESPDGVEIRSAKLVFKRGTSRTGDVGATQQPGYLNAPFGAK